MTFIDKEHLRSITKVALAAMVFGTPFISPYDSGQQVVEQRTLAPDLGLRIDQNGFFKAVNAGPKYGVITRTFDKTKMDCITPSGDICLSNESSDFIVAINQPMADFMFDQAKLTSPIRPVKMAFTDNWLEINDREHVAGFIGITEDEQEIDIVISLKNAAYDAFKYLDQTGVGLDYFDGVFSFLISQYSAHEFGHAGAEAKKLAKPGKLTPDTNEEDLTHPQVFAFDNRYDQLYRQAIEAKKAEAAFIFAAQPVKTLDLRQYKARIYGEARARGMVE